MLTQYAANPAKNWKNKDAAIYLVTSLAAKGQTQKHGITQTNQLFNIVDFYQTQILLDLMSPNGKYPSTHPSLSLSPLLPLSRFHFVESIEINYLRFAVDETSVLKADAIKYVMIFRNQLPPQIVKESIPQLSRFLVANAPVVHTYAAIAIDKILLVRQADKTAL